MPYTVPNQRTVFIHRNMLLNDFLGIQNANWQAAARDLGAHALMLYLYLASNANNYEALTCCHKAGNRNACVYLSRPICKTGR